MLGAVQTSGINVGTLVAIIVPITCVFLAALFTLLGYLGKKIVDRRASDIAELQDDLRELRNWLQASAKDRADLMVRIVAVETHLNTPGTELMKRNRAHEVATTLRERMNVTDFAANVLADVVGEGT